MEFLPVGKRTRSQRAKMVMEQNKRARLAAVRKWQSKKETDEGGGSGKKHDNLRVLEDNNDDKDDDNEAIVIDEEEFLRGLALRESEKNSQIKEMVVVKKELFDHDDDGDDEKVERGMRDNADHDEKVKEVIRYGVNGDESDDESLQIIGERWNPLGLVYDRDYNDDIDDDDGCLPWAVEISSDDDDGEVKSGQKRDEVEEGGGFEEKDDSFVVSEQSEDSSSSSEEDDDDVFDRDFVWEENESSDGSYESSSSECSVEQVNERKLNDDEVDGVANHEKHDGLRAMRYKKRSEKMHDGGNGDDDEFDGVANHELFDELRAARPKNRKDRTCDGDNDDDDDDDEVEVIGVNKKHVGDHEVVDDGNEVRDKKRKEKILDGEMKRRVSEEEKEEVEVEKVKEQVIGEKRKRGRPGTNTNVAEFESLPSKNLESTPCRKQGSLPSMIQESPLSGIRVRKQSKDKELQNTILNTILEEGNKGIDEIFSSADEFYLPLKFKYGVEELIVHEKAEVELEVDDLFNQLEFALKACNIGADDSPMFDNEGESEDAPSNDAISRMKLCAKGKHYLILNEEIGVICKFCSYVHLEIKHVLPEFNKDPFGRGNRREYDRFLYEEYMAFDGFQFPGPSYNHRGPSPSDDIQGTVWDLIPGVRRTLYPHQREGFEFIWKNIAGGIKIDELDKPTSYGLGGCIICHAPGTGKTRLAIVFLQSFMKHCKMANPVIVAPSSMLRTWEEEFGRWKVDIPFFSLNDNELSGEEDPRILKYAGNTKDKKTIRSIKLLTWASGKGVLGISYSLLRRLAGEEEGTNEQVREILLEKPGILILDEGHTARNEKSYIWRVLCQISTKRRVILSGTPFQNNFEELNNTIALVREEVAAPVLSGYYEQDDRRIEELRKRIKPFVHVHKGEILRETLKGLFHSLIYLKPSDLQNRCLQHLEVRIKNRLRYDNLVSLTSVHPSICCDDSESYDNELIGLLKKHRMDLDAGVKTRFLVDLIKLSKGERVLVFGQFIPPLIFIADLLKSVFCWTMGSELLYMHGKQDLKERQSMIRVFNDPKSEARVLLASTKACSEGIHLVGASRVVLLDVVWNPSVERQAISRAYRLGQQRDVYVYHLIAARTLEEEKYQRQATKERLSELMFSSSEGSMQSKSTRSRISEDCVLEEMILHEKVKNMFAKVERLII